MNLLFKGAFLVAEIKDVRLGTGQVNKIYCGTDLVFEKIVDTTAPITTPRPLDLANNPTNTYYEPQTVWLDVNEMCDTYYTLDGGTPTTAAAKYVGDGIYMDATKVLKYFSVDQNGNTEAVKTTTYNIVIGATPTTTISPSSTTQNSIPFTVTLSTDEVGATIYYKLGTGAQQTYTAPFSVTQSIVGVQSTNILVTYWAVGAEGTESQKSITYNTAGAIAGKAVVTATPASWYVSVDWGATANATSYNVYRSTAAGVLGDLVSEFLTGLHYDDNLAINGTTYYYTVRAANYGGVGALSDQAIATPNAAPSGWRYLKIQGYGATEAGQEVTTRLIEFEAWEGATNRMLSGVTYTGEAPSNAGTGGALAQIGNGVKTSTSNTYPFWWTATPNANIIIDFGTARALTKLNYYGYSLSGVQRANRFNVLASNTNNGTDWVNIWNMQTNTTLQPILPNGYEKIL